MSKLDKKMLYAIHKKINNKKFIKVGDDIELRFSARKLYNILKKSGEFDSELFGIMDKHKNILDEYNEFIFTIKKGGRISYRYNWDEEGKV